MTLLEQQNLFAELLPRLIDKAHDLGFKITIGEVQRSAQQAAANAANGVGTKNSLHIIKLAVDLNLFQDGHWLTSTETHRALGTWWKQQHALARWGGDFAHPDGNHYSLEWEGRR